MSRAVRGIRWAVLVLGLGFMVYGIARGELAVLLNKSIHICLECIGLG